MKRTLLFWMAVLFAAIGNVQTTFAQKASLNAADGWTQITSMPDNPSQYFFAIYDHEQDLGMVFKNGANQGDGNWTMWYTADVNPMDNEAALWMIGNNGEYQVIANFTRPQTMLQTEWNAAWFCHATDNGGGGTDWGNTKFTYLSDGYWTIQNGQYPDAGYVGPWADVKQDNAEIAANKQGDAVGHFDIFAITRQQYWINRVNAGLTYPFDMTNAIANTDAILQPNQGWTETYTEPRSNGYTFQKQGNDGLPNKVAQVFFESWQGSGNLSDRQMEQTLANMPVGNYKLTVNTDATATGAFLYAGSNEIDLSQKVDGVASLDFKVSSDNQNINLGIKLVSHLSNWVKFDHFQLTYYRLPIKMEAVELPTNGDMVADQWYYIDILSDGDYSAIANTLANVVYTTDGELQIDDPSITTQFEAVGNSMSAGRYYIKSSSDNNFAINNIPSTAEQMQQLATAIAAAEAHTLGFDNGDYAPYNNVEAIATLAQAKAIDQSNPSAYTETAIDDIIAALQNAVWTANSAEVNAVAYGDLSQYQTVDGKDYPYGWTNLSNEGGNLSRIMGGSEGTTNAGLSATSNGKAMLQKYNATYGELQGYTMPLKANTTYMIKFKYCGWNNTPTTNVIMTLNGNAVTVSPASFRPETGDGHSDASHWYDYLGIFTTTDAGNYVLSLNKVESGQQQIAWGDMEIKRYDNSPLPYTLATGQMNADVATAQANAASAYEANSTLENYNALLAAIDAAKASVNVYTQINQRLALLTAAAQRGSLSEETVKTMAFYTKYSDGSLEGTGTYTSLDEVLPEYRASIAAHFAATPPAAGDDLTAFIVNQSLDFGNSTGWSGGAVNQGNIEWYNGNFDVFQTLSGLPAGTYKLQAQGYYRPGNNANVSDAQNAVLYGGSSTSPVVLIASEGKSAADGDNGFTTSNTNTGSEVFVPNSQADAAKAFASDAYNNEVQFVATGGDINVGFKKDVLIGEDWTCFDNFRLIFLTSDILVDAPALVDAPMNADIRTAQQTALDTWSNNKSIENYNALLAAIDAAQASADKYVIIDQRIPKLQAQADPIDATVLRTKYTDGEYVEPDDVFDAYRTVIAEYYAANPPAANDDMSRFLINPGFEYGNTDGWNAPLGTDTGAKDANNPTYKFTNSEGNYVFNTWSNWDQFLWIVQQTEGLPQGTYEVTAVFAGDKNRTIEFTAEDIQPKGSEQKLSFQPVDEDITYDKTIGFEKTITVFVSDGKLKVGAHANVFFKCDNFRLKFISTDINDPDLTKPMNRFERQNYIDARADYDANPTQENLNELLERKLIVENSIRAYEAAKETFDHVLEMMSKTNVYTYDAYFTIDDMYRKYGPEEGYYHYETLEDDVAFDMWRMFFGNGWYRDPNNFEIPAVPFIASAWDCGHDGYAYAYTGPGEEGTDHGSDYYANTWSMEGKDDGTFMYLPYLEYWREGDNLLDGKTMTATVDGTPGAEYTVKMLVRVRTYPEYTEPYPDPNNPDIDPMTIAGYPKGMTIQIGDGEPVTPRWTKINNADSPYRGTNGDKLWICDLWNYAEEELPKGHVDQDGKLRIKFILDENMNNGGTSNVAWLSFKYVYVNYDGEDLTQALADLQTEVDYANANYYAHLGFDPEEYAPYTNVDELIALKRAQQVHDASENYFLVKAAHDKLYEYNHGGENGEGTWTKNPYEMNGFYWTDYWNNNEPDKYTADDVQHVEWYEYEDDCITPSGWNLIGRNDGFSTGIVKLGVNSDGEGLKSAESETALRAKYETDYGQETGYTLPLKAGVKYIMTFTYAYEGDNPSGCPFETRISLSAPRTGVDNVLTEPLTVTEIQPLLPSGGENQANWYMYRATFVPEYTADYVITFDKDNVEPEPVLYGDLTLVRYYDKDEADAKNNKADYIVDGDSHNFDYALDDPAFEGRTVKITRTFQKGTYTTLVLPFKLAECELKEALGENFDGNIYVYTGAERTDTPGYDYYQLKFETRQTGVFANVPILFFNNAETPVNDWTDKVFNKMVTKHVENELTIDAEPFDFIGTYQTMKIPNGGWYLKNNEFRKSSGKANLSPTCAYFIPFDTEGEPILGAKLMGFSIDDTPTGIIAIEEDGNMTVTSGNIYTIDGRLVRQNATSLEGLEPGTYIVDGKKYIIR